DVLAARRAERPERRFRGPFEALAAMRTADGAWGGHGDHPCRWRAVIRCPVLPFICGFRAVPGRFRRKRLAAGLLRILRSSAARSAGDAVVGNGFQTRDGSPDSIRATPATLRRTSA